MATTRRVRVHRILTAGNVLVGAALSVWLLSAAPARAQLTVVPQSLSETVEQGEMTAQTVTLTNSGSEPLTFCLSFERPLEEGPFGPHLATDALSSACGTYGEVLLQVSQLDLGIGWDPYGITMTPDGRLFAADSYDGRTHELTPELELVRSFEHPRVAELAPFPPTRGVTYNADTGTLWWMNIEDSGFDVRRALLLEGDFDGSPTGRQVEIPVAGTAPDPYTTGRPVGLSYDALAARYYFVDFANDDLWAVDTLGNVAGGYPVEQQAYAGGQLGFGVDAHHGIEGDASESEASATESLWLEVGINRSGDSWITRVVAVDANGVWSGIETPTPVLDETGSDMGGAPLRSRLDPNGVMYYPYSSFDLRGVVAVRPHPLPPRWLVVGEEGEVSGVWDGTLAPGESREIILTFRPGAREVGDYTASLQVFEAATGEAVEVPLVLSVTQGTEAEEEIAEPGTSALSVYPNPSFGDATVALTLDAEADIRLSVYDVIGRVVAVLHDGPLGVGEHMLALDAAGLPAGLYVVRAEGARLRLSRRVTLLR